jgi:hypothetical protein
MYNVMYTTEQYRERQKARSETLRNINDSPPVNLATAHRNLATVVRTNTVMHRDLVGIRVLQDQVDRRENRRLEAIALNIEYWKEQVPTLQARLQTSISLQRNENPNRLPVNRPPSEGVRQYSQPQSVPQSVTGDTTRGYSSGQRDTHYFNQRVGSYIDSYQNRRSNQSSLSSRYIPIEGEPPRDCRRLYWLSYAAKERVSREA